MNLTTEIRRTIAAIKKKKKAAKNHLAGIQEQIAKLDYYFQMVRESGKISELRKILRLPQLEVVAKVKQIKLLKKRGVIDRYFLESLGIIPKNERKICPKTTTRKSPIMETADLVRRVRRKLDRGLTKNEKEIIKNMLEGLRL